jgi:hypothetical protein
MGETSAGKEGVMNRTMRTIALTLLCLVTFATSASAECAWVLWKEEHYTVQTFKKTGEPFGAEQDSGMKWDIDSVFPSAGECQSARVPRLTRLVVEATGHKGQRARLSDDKATVWAERRELLQHPVLFKRIGGDKAVTLGPESAAELVGAEDVFKFAVEFKCLPDTIDPRGPKGK